MNAYLNYLIEANIALVLFFLAFAVLFRKETDFKTKRIFLLAGIVSSLLFPLIHLQNINTASIPSIRTVISAYWLPEIRIEGGQTHQPAFGISLTQLWLYIQVIYVLVVVFCSIRFLIQLFGLVLILKKSNGYNAGRLYIIESTETQPTFSFFHFIFIGQVTSLSANDKQKIIQHEAVHIKQLHSLDIILLHLLGIVFWFNPIIKQYKKIFVQLHEFEADARAVENTEVNEYCNLLAKVALQSADFQLANYFNQSLTLKRIEMMRKIKHKIKPWKKATLGSIVMLLFFVVACQDQLADATDIAKNSSMALDVPPNVQKQFEEIQRNNPNNKYILIELNENGQAKLDEMKPVLDDFMNNSDQIASLHVIKEDSRGFIIVENTSSVQQLSTLSSSGEVFSVVEDSAMPKGGMGVLTQYIMENMEYPDSARANGIEGKVFVEFIVNIDGSISDVRALKGLKGGCTREAIRIMKGSPEWIPGMQGGKPVRQRMVMPFNFQLGGEVKQQKVGLNFLPPILLFEATVYANNC